MEHLMDMIEHEHEHEHVTVTSMSKLLAVLVGHCAFSSTGNTKDFLPTPNLLFFSLLLFNICMFPGSGFSLFFFVFWGDLTTLCSSISL